MQDFQHAEVIFRNVDTKETKRFKIDHSFYDSPEQIRIILSGEEYKLLSTKSPEQLRIEKAIVHFGEKEFLKIAKWYPEYGTSSKNLTLPPDIRSKIIALLDRPGYKTLRRAVNKDPKVLENILRAFVYFISTTRAVDALLNESKTRREDTVYLIDYTKRNQKLIQMIMDRQHPVTKGDLKRVYEQISKDVELDDRRPLGVEQLLNAMSPLTTVLERYKSKMESLPDEQVLYADTEDPLIKQLWNELYAGSLATNENLESLLEQCNNKSTMFSEMLEDKHHYHTEKVLKLHEGIVDLYTSTIRQSSQDPDHQREAQEKFAVALKRYVSDISNWGCDFVCDRRPLSPFLTKMLELQYDTVFFYLEQRSSDENWIFNLITALSTHITYLKKSLAGELPQQKKSAQ